jgi:hypothetical protein
MWTQPGSRLGTNGQSPCRLRVLAGLGGPA